jgi:hypothetical protein
VNPRGVTTRNFDPSEARDLHGRWTSGGDVGVGLMTSAAKTGFGDWSSADVAAVMARPAAATAGLRDDRLLEMWHRQGFTGKPQVVTKAEFDALGSDHERLFRGLHGAGSGGPTAAEYAEAFRSGDEPFPGLGVLGNGTYTTPKQEIADSYAQDGGLLRMALRPDARVVDFMDLLLEDPPDDLAEMIDDDTGKLATALGYDAFRTGDVVIVLNRTALIVQEAD